MIRRPTSAASWRTRRAVRWVVWQPRPDERRQLSRVLLVEGVHACGSGAPSSEEGVARRRAHRLLHVRVVEHEGALREPEEGRRGDRRVLEWLNRANLHALKTRPRRAVAGGRAVARLTRNHGRRSSNASARMFGRSGASGVARVESFTPACTNRPATNGSLIPSIVWHLQSESGQTPSMCFGGGRSPI